MSRIYFAIEKALIRRISDELLKPSDFIMFVDANDKLSFMSCYDMKKSKIPGYIKLCDDLLISSEGSKF